MSLKVQIGAELRELENALSRVERNVTQLGNNLADVGKTLSTRVTAPIVGFATLTVRAFGRQEDAERKLRAALQANGREVDSLFQKYNTFAKELQQTTRTADEATLEMLQQAEAMGITGDAAERAVKNAVALEATQNMNAQSAIRYTAALEKGNATMLSRYLPTLGFIDDQTERAAKAQELLAASFSVAEEAAQTSSGRINALKMSVGDLMEEIGAAVSDAILPFVDRLKEITDEAQRLNPTILRTGVVIGGLVAAIGPALFIGGKFIAMFAKAIGTLTRFSRVLAAVISPLLLKISLIAGLVLVAKSIFDTFEPLQNFFSSLWTNIGRIFENAVNGIIDAWNSVRGFIARVVPGISDSVIDGFEWMNSQVGGKLTEFGSNVKKNFNDALGFVRGFVDGAIGGFKDYIFAQDEVSNSLTGFSDLVWQTADSIREATTDIKFSFSDLLWTTREDLQATKDEFKEFGSVSEQLAVVINQAIVDMAESFADSLASMMFTGEGFSNFGAQLLSSLGDLAVRMGRIILAAGIGIDRLRESLKSLSGAPAIAAGLALIGIGAIGKAASSALNSVGNSMGGGGGSIGSPVATDVSSGGNVTFEIGYDKLYGVLDNGSRRQSRSGRRNPLNV